MNTLDDRPRTPVEAAANRAFWSRVLLGLLAALLLPLLHGFGYLLPASFKAREEWERAQVEITGLRQQVSLLEKEQGTLDKDTAETVQKAGGLESQAAQAVQDAEKLAQESNLSAEQATQAESRQRERLEAVFQALDTRILSAIRRNP